MDLHGVKEKCLIKEVQKSRDMTKHLNRGDYGGLQSIK